MSKPRAFVSSVMQGFEDYRQAARAGIEAAGGEPVLVEDYPSLPSSPRTACLDGVASCDFMVLVLGERGGWTAPSGKLVVEEEYDEAQRKQLPTIVFLQDTQRDTHAERLAQNVSSYVSGLFRKTFQTPSDLRRVIQEAATDLIAHHQRRKADTSMIDEKLSTPYVSAFTSYDTTLRFVLMPERDEEVLDPVLLESPELERQIHELGHSPQVGLLSYRLPKSCEAGTNEIVILQEGRASHRDPLALTRLALTTQGMITIDVNVTGLRPTDIGNNSYDSMSVYEDDVASRLRQCFAFGDAFWDRRDPYRRHSRLFYNAALGGVGMRMMRKEPPRSGSCPVGQYGSEVFRAFDKPRVVTRQDLAHPDDLVGGTVTMFRRRLKQ